LRRSELGRRLFEIVGEVLDKLSSFLQQQHVPIFAEPRARCLIHNLSPASVVVPNPDVSAAGYTRPALARETQQDNDNYETPQWIQDLLAANRTPEEPEDLNAVLGDQGNSDDDNGDNDGASNNSMDSAYEYELWRDNVTQGRAINTTLLEIDTDTGRPNKPETLNSIGRRQI
jgi:hypothetical protein